jgi:hypothetical protein
VILEGAGPTLSTWACPESKLCELREARAARRLSRDIFEGKITKVLLDAQRTQHVFRPMKRHDGKIEAFLEFFNFVRSAHTMHADIMANEPATISVAEEFAEQRLSIDGVRDRSLWDSTFHEACLTASVESYALIRADRDRFGEASLDVLDNDEWFPVGAPGSDGQPSVFERRWIIERKAPGSANPGRGETKRFLRIERHRKRDEDGRPIVEQEAFATESCDVLQCTAKLTRVPLASALPQGAAVPPDALVLDLDDVPIVQLVNFRYRKRPQFRVGEHNLAVIDQNAASLSQLSRAIAQHGSPKFRVSKRQVDEKTGMVNLSVDAFEDPDKIVESIPVAFQFEEMMQFLDRVVKAMLITMEISPALIGMKMGDGSNPDTVDKLRLESTHTLAAAKRAIPNMRPAIERVWTVACMIESLSVPAGGWPVTQVQVKLHPGIPVDDAEKNRAQLELLAGGGTSEEEAFRVIHGEDRGPQILEEKRAAQERLAKQQQAALFGAVGSTNPFDAPSTGDQPSVDDASTDPIEADDVAPAIGEAASESVAADAAASGQKVADTAYTGIQIDKAIQYAERVRNGTMELETAIAHLTTFFPLTEAQARLLVEREQGKATTQAPEVAA